MGRILVFVLLAIAIMAMGGCKRPASHEMTAEERDKIIEEKKRNANWGKSIDDAKRMEEISRQRAQQQRDSANK